MRSRKTSGSAAYYDTTRRIFELESEVLTGVLPHAGERGANDEERCRAFLAKVLPKRYSIGTGFVVSSDPAQPMSPQQDIVIYDDFLNAPLHRELSAAVFPIEVVYGTVEVKGRLYQRDLKPILESIGRTRKLGMHCWYQQPLPTTPPAGRTNRKLVYDVKRPPRAFVFAYDTRFSTLERFQQAWQKKIDEVGTAHLHGIVVLKKNWYAFQVPYQSPSKLKVFRDNALMRFVNGMLEVLRATTIHEAVMDRYLNIEAPPMDDLGNEKSGPTPE